MIKQSNNTSMCLCKDADGKVYLISEPRSEIKCIDGKWEVVGDSKLPYFSPFTKIPISAKELLVFGIFGKAPNLYSVVNEFLKDDSYELTHEEPLELHLKTTYELVNYTIE